MKPGGNESHYNKTHSLVNKSPTNESDSEYTTGKKQCPKASLKPNNIRTDSSSGSEGKVNAYRRLQMGTLVWDFCRKHRALTAFKVKEGRCVDLETGMLLSGDRRDRCGSLH